MWIPPVFYFLDKCFGFCKMEEDPHLEGFVVDCKEEITFTRNKRFACKLRCMCCSRLIRPWYSLNKLCRSTTRPRSRRIKKKDGRPIIFCGVSFPEWIKIRPFLLGQKAPQQEPIDNWILIMRNEELTFSRNISFRCCWQWQLHLLKDFAHCLWTKLLWNLHAFFLDDSMNLFRHLLNVNCILCRLLPTKCAINSHPSFLHL